MRSATSQAPAAEIPQKIPSSTASRVLPGLDLNGLSVLFAKKLKLRMHRPASGSASSRLHATTHQDASGTRRTARRKHARNSVTEGNSRASRPRARKQAPGAVPESLENANAERGSKGLASPRPDIMASECPGDMAGGVTPWRVSLISREV